MPNRKRRNEAKMFREWYNQPRQRQWKKQRKRKIKKHLKKKGFKNRKEWRKYHESVRTKRPPHPAAPGHRWWLKPAWWDQWIAKKGKRGRSKNRKYVKNIGAWYYYKK